MLYLSQQNRQFTMLFRLDIGERIDNLYIVNIDVACCNVFEINGRMTTTGPTCRT